MIDILLEDRATQPVHYFCLATNNSRYDFILVYSTHFYNKSIVISIQTGKMVLMSQEDIDNEFLWKQQLGIDQEDMEDCQQFFQQVLNKITLNDQY